ncbi:hypothetical protein KR054_002599 [Drosophila jambulina]|nr:hypothetical protein KR054_002599 [Drosophila jambulina]
MDKDQAPGSSSSTGAVTHWSWRGENPPVVRNENSEDLGNIAAEVAKIYNADRQDSLQALRARRQSRTVAATSEFISLEDLLRTQAEPAPGQEIVDMILRDFCSSPTYVEEEDLPACESLPWFRFRKKKIRTYARKRAPVQQNAIEVDDEEEDDRLSCSSGLSVQEDHTAPTATSVCELDANTSQKICENLLNLSQYFSLSNPSSSSNPNKDQQAAATIEIDLPTKVAPDPPKQSCTRDRRSNLSDTNSSAECTAIELENLESDLLGIGFTFEASEVCDIKPQGKIPGNFGDSLFGDGKTVTTIVQSQSGKSHISFFNGKIMNMFPISTDSKVCADWSEGDSLLENYNTEKMCLSDEELEEKPQLKSKLVEVKSEAAEECTQSLLDGIPISEWQTPMDIPEESIKETAELGQIEVNVEPSQDKTQETVKASTSKCINFVGFRTASNKPIEITEEMTSKGAMFIAQFNTSDQLSQSNDAKFLEGIAFSEWQPIDFPEKLTVAPAEEELNQSNNRNNLQTPETKTPNKSQSVNIPQLVAFRKTPYKFMEVAEEMKIKGDKLMAEVESGLYQPSQRRNSQNPEVLPVKELHRSSEVSEELKVKTAEVKKATETSSEFVGFRTASNKQIVVSEEMKIKAAQFMAEFQNEVSSQEHEGDANEDTGNINFIDMPIGISEEMKKSDDKLITEVEISCSNYQNEEAAGSAKSKADFVCFRTASNKAIVISEAMKAKAAIFIAEFQAESHKTLNLNPENKSSNSDDASEVFGFQTASNKRMEISEETNNKAAQVIAEVQTENEVKKNQQPSDNECLSDTSDNASGEEFKGFPERGRLCKISNSSPDQNRQQASRKVHKTISCHSGLGTPIQSQEIHASLTQLAGLSPLDQKTKTSVIARRNLLTLSKRRKRSRTPTGTLEGNIITPIKSRLAAMPASTSTPLADRNTNQVQDATATKQSAEDMSPICMPPNKSRRLGLSRSRY